MRKQQPATAISQPPTSQNDAFIATAWMPVGVFILILAAIGLMRPAALFVILAHGWVAALLVAAAAGLGWAVLQGIGLRDADLPWRIIASVILGLGLLAGLVLVLGSLGNLNRSLWIILLAVLALTGLRMFWPRVDFPRDARRASLASVVWLAAAPFAVAAWTAATIPPGILWPEEANGYDVLEYHLAVPREFVERDRIEFLPHNIYSNFPLNVEMLYLLAMVLRGGDVSAAFDANLVNAALGALAVAAAWLAAREFGRPSGRLAAIVVASCPFMTYLSGLAYVENGMLAFTGLALAAMLRATRTHERHLRWVAVAGLSAGLACGCKYTALPMVAAPLLIGTWLLPRPKDAPRTGRAKAIAVFSGSACIAFAPWMIRNLANTGNPVFPLAHDIFPLKAGVWNEDGATRWDEGHRPSPEDRSFAGRLHRLEIEVLAARLYGPGPAVAWLVLVAGAVSLRRFRTGGQAVTAHGNGTIAPGVCLVLCGGVIVGTLSTWTVGTHLVGRFAVTIIPPSAVLLGWGWSRLRSTTAGFIACLVILAMLAINASSVFALMRPTAWQAAESPEGVLDLLRSGAIPGQAHLPVLNKLADEADHILMVGDARRYYLPACVDYCVVFNPNPFAEAAAERDPAELMNWLRQKRYHYLYVDWSEMHRLRTTRYGFWKSIDPSLFERLVGAGLRPIESFTAPPRGVTYSTVFEIPRE